MLQRIQTFLLKNTNIRQTLFKNTIWLFVGEAGVRFLKIGIFIYAARNLGTTEWGIFSYGIALMALFAIISDIGINPVIIREKTRNINYSPYIATGLFIKITLSIIAALLLFFFSAFLGKQESVSVILPLLSIVLFVDSLREFSFTINRAFERMEIEAFGKITTTIVLLITGFVFMNYSSSALSLTYAYIISSLAGLGIGYFFTQSEVRRTLPNFNKSLIVPLLKEALPLGLVSVFGIILSNLDTVILGWFKSVEVVGIYSIAQKLIQLTYLLPILLGMAILPVFSRLAIQNKEKMRDAVAQCLHAAFLLAMPIAVISAIFSEKIVFILFGQKYIQAGVPFAIMTGAILFSAPGAIISNGLFAEGRQKDITKAIILGIILNTASCILLVPSFGIYGAALSAALGQIASNISLFISARKIQTLHVTVNISKMIWAALLMAGILFFTENILPFLLAIVLGFISYIYILFIWKEKAVIDIMKAFQ